MHANTIHWNKILKQFPKYNIHKLSSENRNDYTKWTNEIRVTDW